MGYVYKHSLHNWTYPSPNTTFVVPPQSESSPQRDSINDCSAAIIACNQPSFVSILTTTNQVDTDANNDEKTQSFATLRKKITEPLKYAIQILQHNRFRLMNIPVYTNIVLQLQQHHWNSVHLEKSILVLKLTGKIIGQHLGCILSFWSSFHLIQTVIWITGITVIDRNSCSFDRNSPQKGMWNLGLKEPGMWGNQSNKRNSFCSN